MRRARRVASRGGSGGGFRGRQWLPGRCRDGAFDPGHLQLGALVIAAGGQPSGRFRHRAAHRECQQGRKRPDQVERPPAEHGDDRGGDQRGRGQPRRERQLVEQHELAAALRAGELADERGRDGYLGADSQPLDEPQDCERLEVRARHEQQAGQRGDQHCRHDDADPPEPVGEDATERRTEQHADRARGDGQGQLQRTELPLGPDQRQGVGDEELVEAFEERDHAQEGADLVLPS